MVDKNQNSIKIGWEEALKIHLGQPSVSIRKGPKGSYEFEIKTFDEDAMEAAKKSLKIVRFLEKKLNAEENNNQE